MAEIRLRKNNTTHHLEWCGSGAPCEERFAFRYNGSIYYIPAMSTQGTKVYGGIYNSLRWYYDTSSPTIAFRKNGKTYYCNKSFTTEQIYDIPAGTYTPSTFKSLIESFMSIGSVRICGNSFTVKINNVTTTISAGSVIYYSLFSSGVTARVVGFGYDPDKFYYYEQIDRSRTTIYCVGRDSGAYPYYSGYENYHITIGTGIKFN